MSRGNGSGVIGTLIVKGVLHQRMEEDEAAGEWVTKTFSATFAIEGRTFPGTPRVGEKVNIGPEDPPLDYWAEVAEVERQADGSIRVIATLDAESQRAEVETNEVSDSYEVLTFYGHARHVGEEPIDEQRRKSEDF